MFYENYSETCQKIVITKRIQRWILESRGSSPTPAFGFSQFALHGYYSLSLKKRHKPDQQTLPSSIQLNLRKKPFYRSDKLVKMIKQVCYFLQS